MMNTWNFTAQELFAIGMVCQRVTSTFALAATLWGCLAVTPLPPTGNFRAQVQNILQNEMLTRQEIANLSIVFHDLQQTLRTKWPDCEVFPLGSFVTGLATKSSDADCMVKIPQHGATTDRALIVKAADLLQLQPVLYSQVRTKVHEHRRIPLLKFIYTPTNKNCDVNFISDIALENSHMMGYYFALNDQFLSLAAILKYWSKVRNLRNTDILASNTLNLLIIFYLQQINNAPPFYLLQRHLIRCPVNNWETNFVRMPFLTGNVSLYQLIGGFFKYYSKFNFDKYVVSPLLGRPLLKSKFNNVDNLPEALSLYKNYMKKLNSKPLALNTKLCVQDAIEQRRNTAIVSDTKALELISHIKLAAKMFDLLPKDLFLRVLVSNSPVREFQKFKSSANGTVLRNCNE